MSQALSMALTRATNALRDGLTPADLPSGTREGLVTRGQELALALAPADPNRVRLILATLADMAGPTETDPNKARFAIERDVADLSGLPEWALAAAARAYRRGEVGDGRWRPAAGEVAKLARAKCEAARAEAYRIERVLKAKVQDRKPIAKEQWEALRNSIKAMADNADLKRAIELQPPDPNDATLRSNLGLPPRTEAAE